MTDDTSTPDAEQNDGAVKDEQVAPEDTPETDGTEQAPNGPTTASATFSEAAETVPHLDGEKYQKGYQGHAPSRDGDNPVDLTLAAVTGQKGA